MKIIDFLSLVRFFFLVTTGLAILRNLAGSKLFFKGCICLFFAMILSWPPIVLFWPWRYSRIGAFKGQVYLFYVTTHDRQTQKWSSLRKLFRETQNGCVHKNLKFIFWFITYFLYNTTVKKFVGFVVVPVRTNGLMHTVQF